MKTTTKIQGLNFKEGDKFQVGEDTSIYTFIKVAKHPKYGFNQLICKNDHGWGKGEGGFDSSFRIDMMIEHRLNITKIY